MIIFAKGRNNEMKGEISEFLSFYSSIEIKSKRIVQRQNNFNK